MAMTAGCVASIVGNMKQRKVAISGVEGSPLDRGRGARIVALRRTARLFLLEESQT